MNKKSFQDMPVNVVILTEGGRNSGYGHIGRCLSIKQAFEEKNVFPDLLVCGDRTLEDIAEKENFIISDWLHSPDKIFKRSESSDIVIVDSYLAAPRIYSGISKRARCPVYLDDCLRINYPRGVVVNGAIFAETLPYPSVKAGKYLLGAKYFPLRSEFWTVPPKRLNRNVGNILVTFGGTDSAGLTPRILEGLAKKYPGIKKTVVLGKWYTNTGEIKKHGDLNTEYVASPGAGAMLKVMCEADLAISAGGQTLYELARTGLPTVAIADASNQVNNLKGWEKAGFISFAGRCSDRGIIKSVLEQVEQLQSRAARVDKSCKGKEMLDSRGAHRIVKKLLAGLNSKMTV